MDWKGLTIGWAVTGSHCSYGEIIPEIKELVQSGTKVYPFMSEAARYTDTRFGRGEDIARVLQDITGNKPVTAIVDSEPTGQNKLFDCFVIAPLTGNTLAKLANAVTDNAVLMAAKGCLRNLRPVVLGISTNDALSNNADNLGKLMKTKNIFFIPFGQDNPDQKPNSCVADFTLTIPAIKKALQGIQLQPLIVERQIRQVR
jgi:dipicolinate synthase subunit B